LAAEAAVDAVAYCEGPARAKAVAAALLPPDAADRALATLTDRLAAQQDAALAAAVAPAPVPGDAESFLDDAKRRIKLGDHAGAIAAALESARIAGLITRDYPTRITGPVTAETANPKWTWYDHQALLGRIFGVLCELGADDAAITTVQPIEPENRQQYYVLLIDAEVRRKDTAAIARMLPVAIKAVEAETRLASRTGYLLFRLTRTLALGGYAGEARTTYTELVSLLDHPSLARPVHITPVLLAELKADVGDLPGALLAANEAGPLVMKPSDAQILMMAALQFANRSASPTASEVAAAADRLRAALPPLMPGPQAHALTAIAVDMAEIGDIAAARQAESRLEAEPRDALWGPHDTALEAIVGAQIKAADFRGALATTLRMTEPNRRWKALLKLAGVRPNP
jgi:hypothetical protein